MSTVISSRDRERIFDELERFYKSKLAALRRKRGCYTRPAQQDIISGEPVSLRIVVSWKGDKE